MERFRSYQIRAVWFLAAIFLFMFCFAGTAWAEEDWPKDIRPVPDANLTGKVVVLHTNDVHGAIQGYAKIVALREAFEKLYKPRLTYTPERIDFDYYRHFNEIRPTDRPVGLFLGSMMGDIRNYCSVIGMSYLIYDEDETLFEDIVNQNADMQFKVAEAVLSTGAAFDFGHFWEDICFKSGPLIDPKLFDKLTAPHYKKITDLCLAHGIDIVSLDCDGVTEQLLRTWIDNGVNTMFPIEVGVWGDQFEPARKKYGERMLGVGGMDKRAFREDKAAVDQEIERMKRLASLGGFIPCPDHRLMPGSKFELVQYYAEKIKDVRL